MEDAACNNDDNDDDDDDDDEMTVCLQVDLHFCAELTIF